MLEWMSTNGYDVTFGHSWYVLYDKTWFSFSLHVHVYTVFSHFESKSYLRLNIHKNDD